MGGVCSTVELSEYLELISMFTRSAACFVLCFSFSQAHSEDIGSAANDPTAAVAAYQLQNYYSYSLHNSANTSNLAQFRAAIPFELGNTNNIFRITLPYTTRNPSGDSGFGDMTLFNLMTFDKSWGRIGIGAVALLPTGEDGFSAEKWGLGPAVGFIAPQQWGLWGVFNQNILTISGDSNRPDVNLSIIQPIVNMQLGNGWSVGSSEMSIVYDWEQSEFTSLPLGIAVNKLKQINGVPVQFTAGYEHNFYDNSIAPEDTFVFTVKALFPK
jgi:hypothetical protein